MKDRIDLYAIFILHGIAEILVNAAEKRYEAINERMRNRRDPFYASMKQVSRNEFVDSKTFVRGPIEDQ